MNKMTNLYVVYVSLDNTGSCLKMMGPMTHKEYAKLERGIIKSHFRPANGDLAYPDTKYTGDLYNYNGKFYHILCTDIIIGDIEGLKKTLRGSKYYDSTRDIFTSYNNDIGHYFCYSRVTPT